jgi:hypothetical protein
MTKLLLGWCFLVLLAADADAGPVESSSKTMSFDACLETIRSVASDLGVAPINIVETNDMRMVRFPTSDGSVLVTCSRPDRKMVMTISK